MSLAVRVNTPEVLTAIFTEAGLQVESVPAPQTWVPLLRTFALRATRPT